MDFLTMTAAGMYVHKCENLTCGWGVEELTVYPKVSYEEIDDE